MSIQNSELNSKKLLDSRLFDFADHIELKSPVRVLLKGMVL